MDETLACGPKGHAIWRQRYRGSLQGKLYRLILNSCLCHFAPQNSPYGTAIWPVWQARTARLALPGRGLLQPAACQPVGQCAHSRAHRSLSAGCGGVPRRPGRAYVWLSAARGGRALPSARVCPRGRPEFSWGCRRRFPRWPWRRGHQAAHGHGAVVTRPGGRLRLVSSSPRRWCNGAGRGCAVRKTPFVCGFSRHFF